MNVLVVKDYNEKLIQSWGVSFNGINPELKDYVECASEEDAFKLQKLLKK